MNIQVQLCDIYSYNDFSHGFPSLRIRAYNAHATVRANLAVATTDHATLTGLCGPRSGRSRRRRLPDALPFGLRGVATNKRPSG